MDGEKIRVGMIGASPGGSWAAAAHIPALEALPQFELRAVATSRPESATAAAERFGVCAYADPTDLLARTDLDLVVVSVRAPDHFALVSAAIATGKAVLCEWPLGRSLEETERLAEAARRRGVRTFIGLQSRAAPIFRTASELAAEGYVGEVLSTSMEAVVPFWGPVVEERSRFILDKDAGVTPLSIGMGHRLDMVCTALGEFAELAATVANRLPRVTLRQSGETVAKTVEDHIAVTGVLAGGAVAAVQVQGVGSADSRLRPAVRWEIVGTEGVLRLVDREGFLSASAQLLGARLGVDGLAALPLRHRRIEASPEVAAGPAFAVAHAYAAIAEDLLTGTARSPTFEDALARHRMLQLIAASGADGERKRLAPAAGPSRITGAAG